MYLEDESKLDEMKVDMIGPEDSPYAKGTFHLKVQIPDRYIKFNCTVPYDILYLCVYKGRN